jgi:hypothetical protein
VIRRWSLAGAILTLGSPLPLAAVELTAQQAASHVGETVTVCGIVWVIQHAHPGGLLHFAVALMQVFPHGWPFVHFLQQVCCASSTHFDATGSRSWPGHGV